MHKKDGGMFWEIVYFHQNGVRCLETKSHELNFSIPYTEAPYPKFLLWMKFDFLPNFVYNDIG